MFKLGRGSTLINKCWRDNLYIDSKKILNNNQFSPNAISHKDLQALMKIATKEMSTIDTSEIHDINENKEFNDLIRNWTEISHKILLILNQKEEVFTKNKNPKSLMAFGAMGAHMKLALQALEATGLD
tara:strand:+ start:779 stop:1162 length:384 start_codon:yes stop_codon:yes gene_type:complete